MTTFASSSQIDACPHLRGRDDGERAAVCAPVGFMGRTIGVLHVATAPRELPDAEGLTRLETVAEQVGARMGALRAMQKVQLQASLDGLTGLPNRRSFEDTVQEMAAHGRPYGVLMADLDRFKTVNDAFGPRRRRPGPTHVLRGAAHRSAHRGPAVPLRRRGVRDRAAGTDVEEAAIVADRLRDLLAGVLAKGDTPMFTVSMGAADSRMGGTLADQLAIADDALLAAKRNGRDQCVIGSPAAGPVPQPRPAAGR
jgi:diguanylate cyclase (GGDEF)-like protein